MIQYLIEKTKKTSGYLSYRDYIEEALYNPDFGYYMKSKKRVGTTPDSDFYTAESLGPVFERLLLEAIKTLLSDENLKDYTFIEFGAEPTHKLFTSSPPPLFKDFKIINRNNKIKLPSKSIVFANEILDAQPFHRFIFQNNQWHERGIQILDNERVAEVNLKEISTKAKEIIKFLPENMPENYCIDFPYEAEVFLNQIINPTWKGIILLFDYGLSWEELITNRPFGTARTYYNHKMGNDLLENPGEQDITCHICWDRLIPILINNGFKKIELKTQESFFVHNSTSEIEKIITDKPGSFNKDRAILAELIHPTHMGSKFKVLYGMR